MRILFGMPVIAETGGFSGKILVDGAEVHFSSPFDALDAGIGMVHQEFSLIPGFTTTENIVLNRESMKPTVLNEVFGDRMSILDRAAMRTRAEGAIAKLGVKLDSEMPVSEMPVGHKQFTEIAREINREKTRILVLDEPTAVLTESEAEILLKALRALSSQGIAIIFISHRLHEVVEVADRVVVLRDGTTIKDVPAEGVSVRDISAWMVGRAVSTERVTKGEKREFGEPILSVENLWVDMPGETVRDVNFTVRKGEIFGIGGLAGQGKLGIPNGIMGFFSRRRKGLVPWNAGRSQRSAQNSRTGHGLRLGGPPRCRAAARREPGVEHRLHRDADPGRISEAHSRRRSKGPGRGGDARLDRGVHQSA